MMGGFENPQGEGRCLAVFFEKCMVNVGSTVLIVRRKQKSRLEKRI